MPDTPLYLTKSFMRRFFLRLFFSIRAKLTLAIISPLLIILVLVALAASFLINASIVDQTQKKIHNDLNAAQLVLEQEQVRLHEVVRFTARLLPLVDVLENADRRALKNILAETKKYERLDILNITDLQGQVFLQAHGQSEHDKHQAADLNGDIPDFIQRTLRSGPLQETVVMSQAAMLRESPDLAKQALIHDPYALGMAGKPVEQRGMFLIAAVPLLDSSGQPLGCLYGGVMLNNNLSLVDRITRLIYGKDVFNGIAIGSATIFLEKIRIATTVRLKDGRRALGTRVSAQVAEALLQRGESWLDRALVIHEWYLTAYEPFIDYRGEAIGALYVGMLEKPLVAVKLQAFLTLFGLLLLGCLLGSLLAGWIARNFSKPILALACSAKKIAKGERDVPLPLAGRDEIGHLTTAFADMTTALQNSEGELQELNRQLEEKVIRRTSQLEKKSLELIETQERLLRHEKLAAIGSLASGLAHEINNPAAIIRGNVEILQMSMDDDASEAEELAEILKQVERISLITQNLLSLSRKQAITPEPVDLPALLHEIRDQLKHQVTTGGVTITSTFTNELPAVEGDRERLRQLFTNILLNAAQAMEEEKTGGGALHISGRVTIHGWVQITIADNGPGIPDTVRKKIFNPFFTTKSKGTGLGLSVSYGIVRAHGGSITVLNNEEKGAAFQIDLPVKLCPVY